MTVVSEELEGRRVRVERIDCSATGSCGPCSRETVGQEGVLTNVRTDGRGRSYGTVDGRNFIREVTLLDVEPRVTFADLDGPAPETFTSQGQTWTVGERIESYGRRGTVMSPTDPAYNERFGRVVDLNRFVPVRFDIGTIDGLNAATFTRVTDQPTATTEETAMPANRVTFTPEQEEKLREVVGRIGREHGACAVAATALQELGVSQPQQTQVATVTIELKIPLANSTGQVQLPNADSAPADYLSKTIGTSQLNTIADRMLADGGRGARYFRRQGDATATITNIA